MRTHQAPRWTQFITPLGGSIAIAGFFLPWIGMEAMFESNRSGTSFFLTKHIMPIAPLIAIAFITSVVMAVWSLYTIIRRTPWKSSLPTLISGGIGLALLLDVYLLYVRIAPNSDFNYTGKFGFWVTATGFIVAIIGVFLIRVGEADKQARISVEEKWQSVVIVKVGGIVALFSFFLPWEGIGSLSGWSGFDLMNWQSLVTIAFIGSVITFGISFYALTLGPLGKLWIPVLICIGIGLGILLSYAINLYFQVFNDANMLKGSGTEIPRKSLKYGFWGAVLGYVVAAVGMFLTTRKRTEKQVEVPVEAG